MKTMWFVGLLGITAAQAQNVFLLGSNTALPPDLNGNVQPVATTPAAVVAVPATTVNVNVNVSPGTAYQQQAYYDPAYSYAAYPYPYSQPQYSPNVVYIGSPGTCGPNYYNYYPYQNSSVIYFGGLQAYRQGYHFRHCR